MGKKTKVTKIEKQAAKQERLIAELEDDIATLQRRLKKAKSAAKDAVSEAEKWRKKATKAKRQLRESTVVVEENRELGDLPILDAVVVEDAPDASWTVTRLRAAARERGVAGYSRLTKPELLDALS